MGEESGVGMRLRLRRKLLWSEPEFEGLWDLWVTGLIRW